MLLSTPAPATARRPRRPTQIASYVPRAAWPEPGVECVGTRPGEHQQKERPAVHDRELTAVADRPEPMRKVLGEVRDSHLAGGDESRWTREQSEGDQDAGDQVASDYIPVAEGNTTTHGRVRTSPAAWS